MNGAQGSANRRIDKILGQPDRSQKHHTGKQIPGQITADVHAEQGILAKDTEFPAKYIKHRNRHAVWPARKLTLVVQDNRDNETHREGCHGEIVAFQAQDRAPDSPRNNGNANGTDN